MKPSDLPAFRKILERHSIGFVLVGGAAIEHFIPSSSRDVDVLVLPKEYKRAASALDHDPGVVSFSKEEGSFASGHFLSGGALVRFDLLEPSTYSGTLTGEQFFDYVRRYKSVEDQGLVIARPPVVWYTRLVIDDWRTYVPKILQDLQSGGDPRWLSEAASIADHCGTGSKVRERIKGLEEAARVLGLDLHPARDPAGG